MNMSMDKPIALNNTERTSSPQGKKCSPQVKNARVRSKKQIHKQTNSQTDSQTNSQTNSGIQFSSWLWLIFAGCHDAFGDASCDKFNDVSNDRFGDASCDSFGDAFCYSSCDASCDSFGDASCDSFGNFFIRNTKTFITQPPDHLRS